MPDMDLQKTGGTGEARDRNGRFRKGRSGNPAGRPRGSVNPATRAAILLLDGEAEALTKKAVELALAGDPAALRLCLERILGVRRGRPVEITLPPLASIADLAAAMAAIAAAAAQGMITPEEAVALSQMVESFTRTLDAAHVERRRRWRGVLWKQSAEQARRPGLRKKQNRGQP
jgi:Family of unknown function (DUF5681)